MRRPGFLLWSSARILEQIRQPGPSATAGSIHLHVRGLVVLWRLLHLHVLALRLRGPLFAELPLLLVGHLGPERRLGLLEDLVGRLGELLAPSLHLGADQHRLLVLRHLALLLHHLLEPRLERGARGDDAAQLLGGDVAVLLSRALGSIPIVGDCAGNGLDPLAPHPSLLTTPSYCVAHATELVELVDVHSLGAVEVVVQPVLSLGQFAGEGFAVCCRDELPVLVSLVDLCPHVQDVRLEVVPLLVRLDNLAHLRLHRALGVHELLQPLLAEAWRAGRGDLEVRLLRAPLCLLHLHPLEPGLPLLAGLRRRLLLGLTLAVRLAAVRFALLLLVWVLRLAVGGLLGRNVMRWGIALAPALLRLPTIGGERLVVVLRRQLSLLFHDLLVLLILHKLSALNLKDAVQAQLRPHLDLLRFCLRRNLDLEGAQLLGRHGQQRRLIGKLGLDLEGVFPVEGQGLQKIHGRARREHRGCLPLALNVHSHAGVALLLLGGAICWWRRAAHPTDIDRKGRRVLDLEVPNLVKRRQDGGLQGTTARDAFLLVHRRRELLAAQHLRADLFHPRNSASSADDLHGVDLLGPHAGGRERGFEHSLDLRDGRSAHVLQIVAGDRAGEVFVLHEALARDRRLAVC
mmetsp:Transcript_117533/g.329063  ORF Transcript_117533/g.329063 Transcript_117533/m.329063 type:complete len:630 (-) Transcript_117533:884-2773(-)